MFFANSGSEANDSQIKMLGITSMTGRPQRKNYCAERSYHGVTMAAAALTGLPVMHTHFDVPTDAWGSCAFPPRTTITDSRMVNRKQSLSRASLKNLNS